MNTASNNQANSSTELYESQQSLVEPSTVLTGASFDSPLALCPCCEPVMVSLKRKGLPANHRFYIDDEREQWARFFQWAMERKGIESWFATLTFRNFIRPAIAEAKCNLWLARLNAALIDSGRGRLTSVRATEWQRRDVIHFHLLLMANGLHSLSRKRYEVRWEGVLGQYSHTQKKRALLRPGIGGGFCRIYDAERSAAPYLAKELNKTRNGELKVGGSWRERCPSSVKVEDRDYLDGTLAVSLRGVS